MDLIPADQLEQHFDHQEVRKLDLGRHRESGFDLG